MFSAKNVYQNIENQELKIEEDFSPNRLISFFVTLSNLFFKILKANNGIRTHDPQITNLML
jgi:hypothetical protein